MASKVHRYFSNGGKPGALFAFWCSTTIDGPMGLRRVFCFGCARGREPELAMFAKGVEDADRGHVDITIEHDTFS